MSRGARSSRKALQRFCCVSSADHSCCAAASPCSPDMPIAMHAPNNAPSCNPRPGRARGPRSRAHPRSRAPRRCERRRCRAPGPGVARSPARVVDLHDQKPTALASRPSSFLQNMRSLMEYRRRRLQFRTCSIVIFCRRRATCARCQPELAPYPGGYRPALRRTARPRLRRRRAPHGTGRGLRRRGAVTYHALPAKRENESASSGGASSRALRGVGVRGVEIAEPEHGAFGQARASGSRGNSSAIRTARGPWSAHRVRRPFRRAPRATAARVIA